MSRLIATCALIAMGCTGSETPAQTAVSAPLKSSSNGQAPVASASATPSSVTASAALDAGPSPPPSQTTARLWEITGKFVTYKTGKPLAGATISLCASGTLNCSKNPRAKRVTTDAAGAFRLPSVPEGKFWMVVDAPPGTSDCESPFTETGDLVVLARDCHEAPGAPGVCDFGTLETCHPFEMPPPPPH
ncbi:MAG: carboxypeptidase regulatory-like domain-containing protein [Polyangiaceae bacterium]|nr:carboxypeptidase regulatory-like domain-containing protein [Polyangiaceae bacterium]